MKSVPSAILREQIAVSAKPTVKIEVQEYGHPTPGQTAAIYPMFMGKLHKDSRASGSHGCAVANDGSLNRIGIRGSYLYHQRVTSPSLSSDYTSWTSWGASSKPCAIAANPTNNEVIVVSADLGVRTSSDNGATWGSWDTSFLDDYAMDSGSLYHAEGVSIAYKPNGDLAIAYFRALGYYRIYVYRKVGGVWQDRQSKYITEDFEFIPLPRAIAICYTTDWCISFIAEEEGINLLESVVLGDGTMAALGSWTKCKEIALTKAKVRSAEAMGLDLYSWQPPKSLYYYTDWGRSKHLSYAGKSETVRLLQRNRVIASMNIGMSPADVALHIFMKNFPFGIVISLYYKTMAADWDSIFIVQKPTTNFKDALFEQAFVLQNTATYAMAIDYRGDYAYATQNSEVWRAPSHYNWEPPSAGTGAGDKITLTTSDILSIKEETEVHEESTLAITLDNSSGQYATLPDTIKRGYRVNLYLGYIIDDTPSYVEYARYFIESITYPREAGISHITLHCVDLWGLLARTVITGPILWNAYSQNEYSIYTMIGRILQAVGAILSYKSRSSLITALYPLLDINAGEDCATIIRQLLQYVPDVLYSFGLKAYIINPISTATPLYYYQSPS